jgi:[protein-PII] uridylyltransferase
MKTKASLRIDDVTNTSVLQVITPDRPGLLAQLANIFMRFDLTLYNAKICTLGERVEDTFYLRTNDNQPLNDKSVVEKLIQTIREELDTRIQDGEDNSLLQSIKIGQ